MKKKNYLVHVSEKLERDVIIQAEDQYEAEEIAENQCNTGEIDLNGYDFDSRSVETLNLADAADIKKVAAENSRRLGLGLEPPKLFKMIVDMLPKIPRSYDVSDDPGFWTDGTQILCPSELSCSVIADFLEDIISEIGTQTVITGYHDPAEDAKNSEQGDHAGFYYVTIE